MSNLGVNIAERQRNQALVRLADRFPSIEIHVEQMPPRFRGTMLLLLAVFEHSQCCHFRLAAVRLRAEHVADEAGDQLLDFLASDGAIDERLADQMILHLAFASGISQLPTSKVIQQPLDQCRGSEDLYFHGGSSDATYADAD